MNKEAKKQSTIAIGVGLIVVSLILFAYAFSAPKEYVSDTILTTSSTESSATASTDSVQTTASSQSQIVSSYDEPDNNQNTQTQVNVNFPVNINTCSEQELTAISGIGESRASAIIQYREYLGGYTSVEQIKEIKGIGDALYEKISPYLTV